MFISVIGPDGSGKSTVISIMESFFREKKIEFYTRTEFEMFLDPLLNFLKLKSNSNREIFLSKKWTFFQKFIFSLWPLVVYFDYLVQHIYLEIVNRKKINIYERGLIDYLVSWRLLNLSSPLIEKLYLFGPHTKFNIILTSEPENLFKRKKGKEFEYYKKLYLKYNNVFPSIPREKIKLDTDISLYKLKKRIYFEVENFLNIENKKNEGVDFELLNKKGPSKTRPDT